MLYVGLDVHSRQSSLCILNAGGGTVNRIQLKGPRSTVVDHLRRLAIGASRGGGAAEKVHKPMSQIENHHTCVDRATLYDELWQMPGTHLARKYGVSDIALGNSHRIWKR